MGWVLRVSPAKLEEGRRHPHRDGAGELGEVAKPRSEGNHGHPGAPKCTEMHQNASKVRAETPRFPRLLSVVVSTHKRVFTTMPGAMMDLDSGFAPSNPLLFCTTRPCFSKMTKRALSEHSATNDNSVYCKPRRKRSEKCC